MPNILQQRTLNEIVKQYSSLYGLPLHKSFLFLVIEKYLKDLELNDIDIEESIIDGADDCGIDAIVIDDENVPRPNIYFFQSKFYEAENAFEKSFEGNELEKIKNAVNDFVLKGKINRKYQNESLVDKLHSIKNLGSKNPVYTIVLCSNSRGPARAAKERLEEFIKEINKQGGGSYLSVVYLDLDKISDEFIAPQQQKTVNIKLQISGKYLTEDTGNARLFVGTIEGQHLASLIEEHGDDLFERNVRTYLRQNNIVNKGIFRTATSLQSPYFVYMNNGLTLTCKKFSYTPVQNSPVLEIENVQIVNGQQTARSLYDAGKGKKLKDNVRVLVRIVETTDPRLLMQIIEATNSQSKVTSRDLHSNDEIQKLIEQNLLSKGYFYEARKNKYRGKEGKKRVDAEVAVQSYYSIFFEQPAIAKDKKKLLFGDKYDELFNESTNPEDILYAFLLLRYVQKNNKQDKYLRKFNFLKDATLHTTALMHRYANNKKSRIEMLKNTENAKKVYEKCIKATAILVKEKYKLEKEKYEHRRTFKDPETYGRILEILLK